MVSVSDRYNCAIQPRPFPSARQLERQLVVYANWLAVADLLIMGIIVTAVDY